MVIGSEPANARLRDCNAGSLRGVGSFTKSEPANARLRDCNEIDCGISETAESEEPANARLRDCNGWNEPLPRLQRDAGQNRPTPD